jgi:hypothetical protein
MRFITITSLFIFEAQSLAPANNDLQPWPQGNHREKTGLQEN